MNKLFILCGIPFSGKSTLAKAIASRFGYEQVDLDDVKFEMYGHDCKDAELEQKHWDAIYQKMYHMIETLLKQGKTVVHDTGNFTKYERHLVRQIAEKSGIETKTIFVDTPKEIAYKRLLQNRKTQTRFDVTDEDFENTVAEMEPPTDDEHVLIFGIQDDVDAWIGKNIQDA